MQIKNLKTSFFRLKHTYNKMRDFCVSVDAICEIANWLSLLFFPVRFIYSKRPPQKKSPKDNISPESIAKPKTVSKVSTVHPLVCNHTDHFVLGFVNKGCVVLKSQQNYWCALWSRYCVVVSKRKTQKSGAVDCIRCEVPVCMAAGFSPATMIYTTLKSSMQ